jgi:hypothetical protein
VAAFAATLALAPAASAQDFTVSTQPVLYPSFDPAVTDYVTRCTAATPVDVTVSAQAGTSVNVDAQGERTGDFTTQVGISPGEAFRVVGSSAAGTATYYVRCLPTDFPAWTFSRSSQPQAEWYFVSPIARTDFQPPAAGVPLTYQIVFDDNGVPVWWFNASEVSTDFRLLPDGNVAFARFTNTGVEERRLDGSLVRIVNGDGSGTDPHEILILPNGNYVVPTLRTVNGQNFCGQTNLPILDNGVEEIAPDGSIVSSWWASNHIPLTEVSTAWCETITGPATAPYDVYHINSIEPNGNAYVLSFRHLDAVYKISKTDGSILWKLGGTARPESLAVVDDPFASDPFHGQHDARVLTDGTLTVHDNGFHSAGSRGARAVRYAIDANAGTATLVESHALTSPGVPVCCGSARKLAGGDWVMAWGSAGLIEEMAAAGTQVFSLTFNDQLFSYRANPVLPGSLSRTALREGMDAQAPRGAVRPESAGRVRVSLVPAFRQCVLPDRIHGQPLSFPSCSSPSTTSSFLTIGTPDANGAGAKASGFVDYHVIGTPSANDADVRMLVGLSDVRRKADLTDYTGELQVREGVRITDSLNGSLLNVPATLEAQFPVAVPCVASASESVGSTCFLTSTFNAIVPGTVAEGKAANWQLGQVQVFDGGSTDTAAAADATLFETQGLFVP